MNTTTASNSSYLFKMLACATSLLLCAGLACAATVAEDPVVKSPDTLSIYNSTLLLNGAGVYSGSKNQKYAVQIYAKQKFKSLPDLLAAPGPKRMVITAVREVDMLRIVTALNRSVGEVADKNDLSKLYPGLDNIGKLAKSHPVLKPGSVMTLDWIPVFGMTIYIDGQLQGDPQRHPELFKGAVAVWLGDAPLDEGLKQSLLAGK